MEIRPVPCHRTRIIKISFFGTQGCPVSENFFDYCCVNDDHPQVIVWEAVLKMIDDVRFMTDVIEC